MKQKTFTRRQFVTTLAAGAGTLIAGNVIGAMPRGTFRGNADPLQTITLGRTGISTTLLGMGTGFSGYMRSSNIVRAGNATSVIRAAYDKGIRYFDCADSYGTHPFTAAALKGLPREKYVIGTKMWVADGGIPEKERPDASVVIDRFRKELNTDYIDLVQLHCMTEAGWTGTEKKFMDQLEELKERKIIRAHGVSVHSYEALAAAAGSDWVDVIHVRINPYGEAMDHKDPKDIVALINKMHGEGKGVIGMKLIGNGAFRNDPDKIDRSLKFVLGLGTVDLIIIGFENPGQIDDYLGRMKRSLSS
ncbi:MAG TPA: aldo/keto reductase [Bacteroidales bacterium]|nr:aldo/keto reductase [Bacteroidales bacterium]